MATTAEGQTKAERVAELLDRIGANPESILKSASGELVISAADDPLGGYTINGKELDTEAAVKRLTKYTRRDILDSMELYPTVDAAKDAQDAQDEKARERHGLGKRAQANASKKRQSRPKKVVERKPTREGEPPEGFSLVEGADLAAGDVVVTDAKIGPERIVEVGSGGKSRGKEYLKWMLVGENAADDAEPRRRFTSPRKKYPAKKTAVAA